MSISFSYSEYNNLVSDFITKEQQFSLEYLINQYVLYPYVTCIKQCTSKNFS